MRSFGRVTEERKVADFLKKDFGDYIANANKTYKSQEEAGGPEPADIQVAIDELKQQLESAEFVDAIELTDVAVRGRHQSDVKACC